MNKRATVVKEKIPSEVEVNGQLEQLVYRTRDRKSHINLTIESGAHRAEG